MPKCKICGTNYHYCSSCDYDEVLSDGYCSSNCMIVSKEFEEMKRVLMTLNEEDRATFFKLVWYLPNDIFEYLEAHCLQVDN